MIPYGKKPKALPAVLSPDEVRRLFDVITQPRLLLIVQLAYGAGLRVSEVVRLQVGDIDAARMVLHIRCAKGRKDRLVPLPPVLLEGLRQHWRQTRPKTWLFAGQSRDTHLSIAQVQRLFGQARMAAGITKKASMHTLRHSYATHLLEAGTDLASLQKLLGHNHLSTTMRYIHLRQMPLRGTTSPLDTLPAAQAVEDVLWDSPAWMSEPSCDGPPPGSTPTAS
jgi:site-specific recombinase XerD